MPNDGTRTYTVEVEVTVPSHVAPEAVASVISDALMDSIQADEEDPTSGCSEWAWGDATAYE